MVCKVVLALTLKSVSGSSDKTENKERQSVLPSTINEPSFVGKELGIYRGYLGGSLYGE